MKKVIMTIICFAGMVCSAQDVQKRQISQKQIDTIFARWNNNTNPGIAVGIVSDGETILTKGYGLANLEHQIKINPTTKFHIGDLAKEFTVYSILLLEQRKQLSLQDDIRNYLPELRSIDGPISVIQLIHHTSGLNNVEVAKALSGWQEEDAYTKKQAYAMIQNQSASMGNTSNEQRYTESGFMVLEDLITKVSGISYTEFVAKEIFKPLGMTNSVFDTNGAVIGNKAQGYFYEGDEIVNSNTNYSHTLLSDLFTTVEDMCLWAKELGDPKIGTEQMVQKFDGLSMVDNKEVAQTNSALFTGGHRFWDYRGARKLYHIEVAGGYASKLIRYPEYDLAIIVMGNDGQYNGDAATGASELYIEEFLTTMPNTNAPEISSIALSKEKLSAYEGTYWDKNNYASRKIHVVNDTLRYFRGPVNESALVPLSENSFQMITRGKVVVSFDSKVNPMKMTVTVGDDTFHSVAYDSNASWTIDLDMFTGNYYAADLGCSYALTLDQENLTLSNERLEPVQLTPRITDVFSGNRLHFSSLAFERDLEGRIKGFKLSTGGVADIWFQKETNPN